MKKRAFLAVAFQKVLGGDLQRLVHALADGDAGHHDDELAPAMALVQLEHALDVAVGLAGAGFHLYVEVERAAGLLVADKRNGQRQVLTALHRLDVFQKLSRTQRQIGIPKTRIAGTDGGGWLHARQRCACWGIVGAGETAPGSMR
jgi:hypothetical protein